VASANSYEIRCARCNVSFPTDAKQCLHCGGPLGSGLAARLRQGRQGSRSSSQTGEQSIEDAYLEEAFLEAEAEAQAKKEADASTRKPFKMSFGGL